MSITATNNPNPTEPDDQPTKLDRGGYEGTAETLDDKIDSTLIEAKALIEVQKGSTDGGSITPTTPMTATGPIFWRATQAGTYTNHGGFVVPANTYAVISLTAAGVFSISQTALTLTDYAKISDIKNDLVSTDTNKPLSANQGKLLDEKITLNAITDIYSRFNNYFYVVDLAGNVGMRVDNNGVFTKNINQIIADLAVAKVSTESLYGVYNKSFYVVDLAGNVGMRADKEGVFGKNTTQNTTDIATLKNSVTQLEQGVAGYGDGCKIQENKGVYIFPSSLTVTGANAVSVINRSEKKFGLKSYQANFSNSDTVNLALGQTVSNASNVGFWWYLPCKYNQGNIFSITFTLTLGGSAVGSSVLDYIQYTQQATGWHLKKWVLSDFGNPISFDGIRIAVFVDGAAIVVGNHKAQFYIDAVVVNQRLKPSIAISYDGVWQESFTAGVFQWHKDNNIPFNITEKEVNQSTSTAPYFVYMQNLVKDNLGCVAVYSQSMDDNTLYPTYASKRDYIKPNLDIANNKASKKVISIGCSKNFYTETMVNAFNELGAKIIRGGANFHVNYIEDILLIGTVATANINTNTRAQEDSKINAFKNHIDKIIALGSFGSIMTHGVMPLADITQDFLHNSDYVWFAVLNYLKTKSDSGLIDVVKFDSIYHSANGTSNS